MPSIPDNCLIKTGSFVSVTLNCFMITARARKITVSPGILAKVQWKFGRRPGIVVTNVGR